MQKQNEETFADISGVHVIADDLTIAVATEQEHDAILSLIKQETKAFVSTTTKFSSR